MHLTTLTWFLLFIVGVYATGCAAHRQISSAEIAQGHLGSTTTRDCKYNPKSSQVLCKCLVFDVRLNAKTGGSVLTCAEVQP